MNIWALSFGLVGLLSVTAPAHAELIMLGQTGYEWYTSRVTVKIQERYEASETAAGPGAATILVEISRDGRASTTVEISSGSAAVDHAIVTAVRDAAPFPPTPAGSPKDGLKLRLLLR